MISVLLVNMLDYEPWGDLWGISVSRYLWALGLIIVALAVRKVVSAVADRWLKKLAARIPGEEDDRLLLAMHKPFTVIMLVVGVYLGIQMLQPQENVAAILAGLFRVSMVVLVLWLVLRLVDVLSFFVGRLAGRTESRIDDHIVMLLRTALKVFLYVVAVVNIMDALGQDVGALVAGLGLGGLAFALAAKDTVANLFGSITIFIDRPFRVGDIIMVDDTMGTVETLGFRSTRIRTFEKTLVSIPNSEMVVKKIENISLRPRRRITMTVGVTYETTHAQMEKVVESLRDLMRTGEGLVHDDFHVYFTEFGASSLDIKIICWSIYTGFAEYNVVREAVNLEIMRRLEKLGVEIAFPSRTVYLKGEPPEEPVKTEKK